MQTKDCGLALDVKAVGDDGVIEGYANVFGVVDSYNETVEPGAFVGSLADAKRKGRKIKLLWQHDPGAPIGIWDDLAEDAKGLWGRGRLLKDVSARAAEAYGLLKEGALDGLSIGYREIETAPHDDKRGVLRLIKLDLKEVSIVTFPANERSRVDVVKSLLALGNSPSVRQFEEYLRDSGFSRSKAVAIASLAAPYLQGEPVAKANEAARFLSLLRTG